MHATISAEVRPTGNRAENAEATCESRESVETNTSRIQNAHFAGMFDADGYIGVFYQKNAYGGTSYGCEAKIGASEVHKVSVIEMMRESFGGRLYHQGKATHLSFRIEEAERLLKCLYPFLVLKKPQAALWFKFREILKQRIDTDNYRHAVRQNLAAKIRAYHASGDGPAGRKRPDWSTAEIVAYAAGLIDGDGSIGMYRCPVVRLSGKPKTLPEWLHNSFGGTLRLSINRRRGVSYWEWAKYGDEALEFLASIKPYSFRMKIGSGHASNCVTRLVTAGVNMIGETSSPCSTSAMTFF